MTSSILLRVLSMASRFGFLLVLASAAPVSVVADYGVLAGFVSAAAYLIGFDLYIQASRNVRRSRTYHTYLSNQLVFSLGAIVVVFALRGIWPTTQSGEGYVLLLSLVLLTDFAQQEFARVFLAHGRYQWANVFQFLRLGLWPAMLLVEMTLLGRTAQDISHVLEFWAGVNAVATLGGIVMVTRLVQGFRLRPSWRLFVAALPRQLLIFSSSAVLLLFSGVDRVLLSSRSGDAYVAAYVFYGSIYGTTLTLIYTGLINPYYATWADRSVPWAVKEQKLRQFGIVAVGFAVMAVASLFFGMDILLGILHRSEYAGLRFVQFYFIAYVLVSVVGMIPHFTLFAQRRDRAIAVASGATLVVFLGTWMALSSGGIRDAMPITLCISAGFLAIAKAGALLRSPRGAAP